jgi:hypothetical protein
MLSVSGLQGALLFSSSSIFYAVLIVVYYTRCLHLTFWEANMIWGDVATWVTGIATIALFIIGFIQIRNERLSRIKSAKEREAHQIRAQAELISCWKVKDTRDLTWIAVLNHSTQPIYQVIVTRVKIGVEGDSSGEYTDAGLVGVAIAPPGMQDLIEIAPPGTGYISFPQFIIGMHHRTGFEISFIDAAGINWVRKANGELQQIMETPIRFYKVPLPTGWNNLATELPPDEIFNLDNPDY